MTTTIRHHRTARAVVSAAIALLVLGLPSLAPAAVGAQACTAVCLKAFQKHIAAVTKLATKADGCALLAIQAPKLVMKMVQEASMKLQPACGGVPCAAARPLTTGQPACFNELALLATYLQGDGDPAPEGCLMGFAPTVCGY